MMRNGLFHKAGISIHAPREGGDGFYVISFRVVVISIHAPREGGDAIRRSLTAIKENFNPRPPRGGRLLSPQPYKMGLNISIHAPREGGDVRLFDKLS